MFGKKTKKLDRKMRRRIRKTSAVMLLISAIVVAAIPVPEAAAAPGEQIETVLEPEAAEKTYSVTAAGTGEIPKAETTDTFYRSEGGTYTFVHKDTQVGGSLAVLLNCVADAGIKDLVIPEKVNAYTQYTTTDGSSRAFAAANKEGGVLYYRESRVVQRTRTTVNGEFEQTDPMPGDTDSAWGPWGGETPPNYEPDHEDKSTVSVTSKYDNTTKKWTQTCAYLEYRFRPCVLGDENVWKHDNVKQYVCVDKGDANTGAKYPNTIFYDLPIGISNPSGFITETAGYDYVDIRQNPKFKFPEGDNEEWLVNVKVGYISDQRAEMKNNKLSLASGDGITDGIPDDTDKKSFFYAFENNLNSGGSIQTVRFPTSLISIADYAFSGCTSLESVSFDEPSNPAESSAISAIGHHAFANCSSMISFRFPSNTRVTTIANSIFEDCPSLQGFVVPVNIQEICDSAFKGCAELAAVDFSAAKNLKTIGSHVFENCYGLGESTRFLMPANLESMGKWNFANCTSLKEVEFPGKNKVTTPLQNKTENISLTNFAGCTALERIDIASNDTEFAYKENMNQGPKYYTYDTGTPAVSAVQKFKDDVGDEFYFAANGISRIHDMTKSEAIAFLYLDRDPHIYEKVIREYGDDGKMVQYIYQVNPNGELEGIDIQGDPETVVIEDKIGPHEVTKIGSQFSNGGKGNDNLKSITIPSTITEIGENAFQGCKNLREVIFEEPNNIRTIGAGAFKTQYGAGGIPIEEGKNLLTFYGKIDLNSVPFQYAMAEENYFTNESQSKEYIDFCSGDGTNVHVKYNAETKLRELQKVPTTTIALAGSTNGEAEKDDYYKTLRKAMLEMDSYTEDTVDAALTEIVKEYDEGGAITSVALSDNVMRILRTAFDVTLPSGIQSIKSGLFSTADEKSTTKIDASGNDPIEIPAGEEYIGPGKPFAYANTSIRSITMDDIEDLEPFTFYGCKNLESVAMYSSEKEEGETIGNYAFAHCPNLMSVKLPVSTADMGKRPFAADPKLTGVTFVGESASAGGDPSNNAGENYSCEKGIIYGLSDGTKTSVVQCLEARGAFEGGVGSYDIDKEELAGITSIAEEAFMNCKNIELVDLTDSNVKNIPKFCFGDASKLDEVLLPTTCTRVDDYAFKDTDLSKLRVPNMETRFANDAFYDSEEPGHIKNNVEVKTMEGSAAAEWVATYAKYNWRLGSFLKKTCTTIFQDRKGHVISEYRCEEGEKVEPPSDEDWAAYFAKYDDYAGKTFTGWFPEEYSPAKKEKNEVYAEFSDTVTYYDVTFVTDKLNTILSESVLSGKRTPVPETPVSEQTPGAPFAGWISRPAGYSPYEPIVCDVTFMASYSSSSNSGNNPNDPNNPSGGNNGGNNGSNNGGNNGSNNGGNNGSNNGSGDNNNNGNDGKLYTLTVVNGSGSGSYAADTMVTVAAYTPNTGYEFYNWTSSENDTNFSSKTMAATAFKMPAKNLTVTANYKTKSETGNSITSKRTPGTVTSSPSSNTGSVNKVDSSTGSNSGNKGNGNSGSSVQVNRPGISNSDVASATVNGSTDNFVVRVTEDGQATAAVAEALRNEYGTLETIHYFAMDISLYDETGTQKVTDTNGLSVTITLPIPDELRQYAGNNKIGAVTGGGNLEKLNPRFTTVNGVPCVTFTATHFSPYTIYVDTANLLAGGYDTTPKTGDAIHPKWFLAVGLGLFSAVLFMKRDKKMKRSMA